MHYPVQGFLSLGANIVFTEVATYQNVNSRDEETGQYTSDTPDSELLRYLRENGPVGTTDIASAFGYVRSAMYRRLKSLENDGEITSDMIGGSKVWDSKTES